ncbi:MAG: hypothetical protein NT023_09395 [Armatimonadetes bacterium]|nr:hypothetical protein [Armatimonadota bacterium]
MRSYFAMVVFLCLLSANGSLASAQKTSLLESEAVKVLEALPYDFTWRSDEYRTEAYIRTAIALQKLGKERAVKALKTFITKNPEATSQVLLYRMLFVAKPGQEFRHPSLSGPTTWAKSTKHSLIAIVDGVPFLVANGGSGVMAGHGDSVETYLDYCILSCDWNPLRFQPVSHEQMQKALDKLINTTEWERPLRDYDKAFLTNQIKGSAEDAQMVKLENLLAALPEPNGGRDGYEYKVEPYIQAAITLQKLGEKRACEVLLRFVRERYVEESNIVLCRMLFAAKPGQEFRLPNFGVPRLIGYSESEETATIEKRIRAWSLAPIEIVDGVPLLIANGWKRAKVPESAYNYIVYCRSSYDWGRVRYQPVSREAKRKAVNKLIRSSKWGRPLLYEEVQFLMFQINQTPDAPAPFHKDSARSVQQKRRKTL